MRIRIFVFCVSLLSVMQMHAQDKSNKGKEFWLAYGYSWNFTTETPLNNQEFVLYLSAEAAATVTVSVANTGWSQTVNIPANTVNASVTIPKTGAADARILTEGLTNRAIHIVSDTPIVVYAHMYNGMISTATMLMPVETYGYKYYSLNYSQAQSGSSPPHPASSTTQNGPEWYSYFFVIASEDNTRVLITPADTTKNGWLPTSTYTVNLNKGEVYNVMGKLGAGNSAWEASKDMSGSKAVSIPGADGICHPIALFSGSSGIRLCRMDGGENMLQQVFPTQAWGTRYLTYHTLNNTNTDIYDQFKNFYRIAVDDPTTVVKRNGVVLTGLRNNFYYEILDSTGGDFIESDKPVLVAQYTPGGNRCYQTSQFAYGDPEMFYLSPMEQGRKDVLFYSTRNAFIDFNYVNIIVPTAGISSLKIDGSPFDPANIRLHPNNPAYSVAVARIFGASGQHRITSDSVFTGTVYGLGYFESYGYNIGTFINNLNNYSEIRNTLNTNGRVDTFTCPKTPFRLTAKLAFPATSIHWKLTQVNGLTPNIADSVISNPVAIRTESLYGRTYYVYTLQQDFEFAAPGIYNIPISYSAIPIENCNQTEFATLRVVVKPGPVADFTISNQQCLSDTVRFTGTTASGIFNYTSYLWNFDDATTQNTINAKKRFVSSGAHDVRYRVYADNGCIGDTTKTVTIMNGTGPVMNFTSSGKPCKDSTILFTSTILPGPNTNAWYWDFGDGTIITSNTHIVSHQYTSVASNIMVRHTANMTSGCSPDTVQQIIPFIFNNPAQPSFQITGDTLCIRKPLQFSSATTGVNSWKWNFGNGTGLQVPPFGYAYNNAGTYTISLAINDLNGCGSLPATRTITIQPDPVVSAGPDKLIPAGSSTTLNATLVNPANYNITWTPAVNLDNATVLNPVSTPDTAIIYTITVTDKVSLCTGKDNVLVAPISKLFIPSAFSPNNDGKNDKWMIPGMALYPDGIVTVFNRWGEKIFQGKDYYNNPWNGYYKNIIQPQDVYIYVIQLTADKEQVIKGTVTIIR